MAMDDVDATWPGYQTKPGPALDKKAWQALTT